MKTIAQTITLQIGNSDNKLTQRQWSQFIHELDQAVTQYAKVVHFAGSSPGSAPWQNYAWVFLLEAENKDQLWTRVTLCRHSFGQDSAAWTVGETFFI